MGIRFEWDREKAEGNLRKHGVAFSEATTVFNDPFSQTTPDIVHSIGEERFWTMGLYEKGRLIIVSHTEGGDLIEIISARALSASERKNYEEKRKR